MQIVSGSIFTLKFLTLFSSLNTEFKYIPKEFQSIQIKMFKSFLNTHAVTKKKQVSYDYIQTLYTNTKSCSKFQQQFLIEIIKNSSLIEKKKKKYAFLTYVLLETFFFSFSLSFSSLRFYYIYTYCL